MSKPHTHDVNVSEPDTHDVNVSEPDTRDVNVSEPDTRKCEQARHQVVCIVFKEIVQLNLIARKSCS